MNVALMLSRRLSLSGSDRSGATTRADTTTVIAVTGISLTVFIMLCTVAIVTGFKHEIVNALVNFNSQITVSAATVDTESGRSYEAPVDSSTIGMLARELPGAAMQLTLNRPAILKTDDDFQGILLKGIDMTSGTGLTATPALEGAWPEADSLAENDNVIALSRITARALKLSPGDKVYAHFVDGTDIRTRSLRVAAVFDTGFSEYDRSMAVVPITMLRRLAGYSSDQGSRIEISGFSAGDVDRMASLTRQKLLSDQMRSGDYARTWMVDDINRQCASYFSWLDLLDTNVVVIITLMTVVACFTLISSLFILILRRVSTIGLLKSLGASNSLVRRTFIYMTQRLLIKGLIIGNATALLLLLLQKYLHVIPLDAEAYYINFVPVSISVTDVVLLNLGIIAVTSLLLILPSCMIARLSPASTLRYE